MTKDTNHFQTVVTLEVSNEYNCPRLKVFVLAHGPESETPHGANTIHDSYTHLVEKNQYRTVPRAVVGKCVEDLEIVFTVSEYDYEPRVYERDACYGSTFFVDIAKAKACLKTLTAWEKHLKKEREFVRELKGNADLSDVARVALVVEALAAFVGATKVARIFRTNRDSRWNQQTWDYANSYGVTGYELIERAVSDLKKFHKPSDSAIQRHERLKEESSAA